MKRDTNMAIGISFMVLVFSVICILSGYFHGVDTGEHRHKKAQKTEDRFLEIEARMNRLVYPYQGWTYGVETGCRGDTVVIYIYVDSIRIYSGGRDTVMVWRKSEIDTASAEYQLQHR